MSSITLLEPDPFIHMALFDRELEEESARGMLERQHPVLGVWMGAVRSSIAIGRYEAAIEGLNMIEVMLRCLDRADSLRGIPCAVNPIKNSIVRVAKIRRRVEEMEHGKEKKEEDRERHRPAG